MNEKEDVFTMEARPDTQRVTTLGSLAEIADAAGVEMKPQGAITSTFESAEQAQEYFEGLTDRYLKQVDKSGAAVCIDGRPCKMLGSGDRQTSILPKMAGGNLHSVWVGLELSDSALASTIEGSTPQERLLSTADLIRNTNHQSLGAHASDRATKENNECGAAMKLVSSLEIMATQPEPIKAITASLVGEAYSDSAMDQIITKAMVLRDALRENNWQGTTLTETVRVKQGQSAIELLISGTDATHNHHEDGVVFNFVSDRSLDRDKAAAERQVFWVDMWAIRDMAERYSDGSKESTDEMYSAMTALQVGTYLALCDGSHQIGVITPESEV